MIMCTKNGSMLTVKGFRNLLYTIKTLIFFSTNFPGNKTSGDINLSDFSRLFDTNFHKRIQDSFKY